MPKFKIVYWGDWHNKRDAEMHALTQHGPNCNVNKVLGPRPRKLWCILMDGKVRDSGYRGGGYKRGEALVSLKAHKMQFPNHVFTIAEI